MKASQSSLRRLKRSSMGRLLMQQANAVETICCNKSVEVLKVESSDVCQPVVVKVWAKKRMALSAAQVAAEFAAIFALDTLRRGAHPRQSVPVATEVNPVGGCYTISVHAGQSLDLLIGPGGAMANLSPLERLPMARRLMATLLLALQDYQQIPDDIGGARQHRDIKTSNIFWRPVGPSEKDFVFVVGDHGGFAATSLLDFFPCFDLRYLDPAMAEVDDNNDYFLLTWHGQRTATRPGLDMFQAALAVLEFLTGKLPEQLDPDQYDVHSDSGISALLHAVRTCDWGSWLKQQGLPEDARQLLLQMLAAQPDARPTPEEALLHPFVADDVALVLQAEASAAKEWQAAHSQVRQLLFGEEVEEEQSDEEEAKSDYYSGEERLGSMNDHSESYWKIQGRLDIEERRLLRQTDSIHVICSDTAVKAYKVTTRVVCKPVVVKYWARVRTATSAAQVAAEFVAGFALDMLHKGPHPRQSVPVATEINPVGGCYTISVHAGQSLDLLIGPGGAMANLSPLERLPMARRLMATLLLALQDYQQIVSDISYQVAGLSLYHTEAEDLRTYLDPAMAEVDDNNDYYLVTWHGQRTATRPGLDMFQAALAVLEFLIGKLPEQLDPDQYDVHSEAGISALLHAVKNCDWGSWLQQQGLPEDARQLLLQMLAAQPEVRPTPEEALLYPFVADDVALVLHAEATAAKEWQAAHQQVRQLLFGKGAEQVEEDEDEGSDCFDEQAQQAGTAGSGCGGMAQEVVAGNPWKEAPDMLSVSEQEQSGFRRHSISQGMYSCCSGSSGAGVDNGSAFLSACDRPSTPRGEEHELLRDKSSPPNSSSSSTCSAKQSSPGSWSRSAGAERVEPVPTASQAAAQGAAATAVLTQSEQDAAAVHFLSDAGANGRHKPQPQTLMLVRRRCTEQPQDQAVGLLQQLKLTARKGSSISGDPENHRRSRKFGHSLRQMLRRDLWPSRQHRG
eukprot:gene12994-13123_t